HTFAHAIETGTAYTEWLHGEAVAVGMLMAAEASCQLGWLPREAVDRLQALLARAGLPLSGPSDLPVARYLGLMGVDKKAEAGR
ncbi:MAG: 3-dehydroquinate synthase, partial [Thiohalorhabdaceae bacterium]